MLFQVQLSTKKFTRWEHFFGCVNCNCYIPLSLKYFWNDKILDWYWSFIVNWATLSRHLIIIYNFPTIDNVWNPSSSPIVHCSTHDRFVKCPTVTRHNLYSGPPVTIIVTSCRNFNDKMWTIFITGLHHPIVSSNYFKLKFYLFFLVFVPIYATSKLEKLLSSI